MGFESISPGLPQKPVLALQRAVKLSPGGYTGRLNPAQRSASEAVAIGLVTAGRLVQVRVQVVPSPSAQRSVARLGGRLVAFVLANESSG